MPRLKLKPELKSLPLLFAFCEEQGVDARLMLALEEAFVNVANHSGASTFELAFSHEGNESVFVLEDDGEPFDPAAFMPPQTGYDTALQPGGQGIRIIRSMTHSMHYRRENGKNILTLTKSDNKKA